MHHPQLSGDLESGTDAFRHVVEAFGDDNPLWCDPSYGPQMVWGGPIPSPNMNGGDTLIGENEIVEQDPETREATFRRRPRRDSPRRSRATDRPASEPTACRSALAGSR